MLISEMVNQKELAICRRRGHDAPSPFESKWSQCKWCGMWVRMVHTLEESEDEPPEEEQSNDIKLNRLVDKIKKKNRTKK